MLRKSVEQAALAHLESIVSSSSFDEVIGQERMTMHTNGQRRETLEMRKPSAL
jgi:hypothetical protein